MTASPLTRALAAAGALPFVACALLSLAGITTLSLLGQVSVVAATYGLTIASFMAGVHWGTALFASRALPMNLFVSSNALTLLAWFAFLLGTPRQTLVVLAIVFVCLLIVDQRLRAAGLIDQHYWQTRLWVTVIVVASLIVTAAAAQV